MKHFLGLIHNTGSEKVASDIEITVKYSET